MAIKPTIYKLKIDLSDMDRAVYETMQLTVARHPSETLQRMMARVMAYAFNAQPRLAFCKGISDSDEPDIWLHSLSGELEMWLDVGEPAAERIKKASRLAKTVKVYSFNAKAVTWWELNQHNFAPLPASIFHFPWQQIQALAQLAERTMELSITISDGSAYVATARGECEISPQSFQTI
jgi:uncharacterized protein YaeQ